MIPVVLKAGEALNVTRIPVNFDRIYKITVSCGKSEEEGEENVLYACIAARPVTVLYHQSALCRSSFPPEFRLIFLKIIQTFDIDDFFDFHFRSFFFSKTFSFFTRNVPNTRMFSEIRM